MTAQASVSGQLVVVSAHEKTYKTGSRGFHGKLLDPATGKRYQVQAVEIGSKPVGGK